MKYLNIKVYSEGPSREEWDRRYELWMEEFATIQDKFPKRFIKEFSKYHFHDNIINSISIEKVITKKKRRIQYHLNMQLLDSDERFMHIMDFYDVRNFNSYLLFDGFAGVSDWLYCEILPVDKNRFSLEVKLFGDGYYIYFDFAKMHYKKIKASENN